MSKFKDDRLNGGADGAARRLYDDNVGLIHHVLLRRFGRLAADPLARDEAWTAGALGLWDAARRWDRGRGVAFSTYAVAWIAGSVNHHLRDEARARRLPTLDLDGPAPGGHGETGRAATLGERTPGPETERPGAALLAEAGVAEMLSVLTERQREAVWSVHGCGETASEVAARMGISAGRVSQLAAAGLKRMGGTVQ
jgi:RNA polymerase sigma factor (sigma-70 family)